MRELLLTKVSAIWLLLVVLTTVSWWLADGWVPENTRQLSTITVALVGLAMFKIRLVVLHFMEIGGAPWGLRGALEAWIVVVFLGIVLQYLAIL